MQSSSINIEVWLLLFTDYNKNVQTESKCGKIFVVVDLVFSMEYKV